MMDDTNDSASFDANEVIIETRSNPDTDPIFLGPGVWVPRSDHRRMEKKHRKLIQQHNQIRNRMIGNARIWKLDWLAMELEMEADRIEGCYAGDVPHKMSMDRANEVKQLRDDALFLRRLQWDLGELHDAVHGPTNRRAGRYDDEEFRGERP